MDDENGDVLTRMASGGRRRGLPYSPWLTVCSLYGDADCNRALDLLPPALVPGHISSGRCVGVREGGKLARRYVRCIA